MTTYLAVLDCRDIVVASISKVVQLTLDNDEQIDEFRGDGYAAKVIDDGVRAVVDRIHPAPWASTFMSSSWPSV